MADPHAIKILTDLIDHRELLKEEQTSAFESMLDGLNTGRYQKLTEKQLGWIEGTHAKLGLDPGTANLFSSGAINVTEKERADLRAFVKGLGPKHLKPPGRK